MYKTSQLFSRLQSCWNNSPTLQNILKVSMGDATSKVFNFATAFLLIRGLSIADYASYTTFSGIAYLFSGIVGTGINIALVRFSVDQLSRGKEKPIGLYLFAILFHVVSYTILAGLCLLFPKQSTWLLFGKPVLTISLQWGLIAGLGLLIIQFVRSVYQAEERFNRYVGTIWLIQVVIFFSLVSLWLSKHLSFLPVAIIFTVVQLGIGLWLLVNYLGGFKFPGLKTLLRNQWRVLKQFLVGSGWLIGYFLILNLFSRMDVLMLLRFKGEEELAIYGVAFQYYSLSLLFLGSVHAVLLPKFSKAEMQEPEKQKVFLNQWLRWSVWLAIPVVIFDVFGKPLFVWINGVTYGESFPIFVIFTFGIWFSMMFSPLVNIIIGRGELRFLFTLSAVALLIDVVGNILVIPTLGGIGAALVIILTQNIFIQIPILLKGLNHHENITGCNQGCSRNQE